MPTFVDLIYDEAPLSAFDAHLATVESGLSEDEAAVLRTEYDVALRLRERPVVVSGSARRGSG